MTDNTKTEFLSEVRPLAQNLIDYATTAGQQFGISDVKIEIGVNNKQENTIEKGNVVQDISGSKYKVTVTLYAGNKTLSFTKNTLGESILCDAIMQNMQVINMVPDNADKRLLESAKVYKGAAVDLDLYDPDQPDREVLIAYAKEAEKAALAQPGVKKTESASITKIDTHRFVLATNGIECYEAKSLYQAVVSVVAEDNKGMQTGYDYSISRHFSDMSEARALGERAGQDAVGKLGATLPETGKMPVVLNHDAAEAFFGNVYEAINGTAVHRGATFLKDKIGQQVMSKGVTLVDDPRIARGLVSMQVDTAGLEAKEITFIEDGILKSFNVDLLEARQLGIEPIGREDGSTNSRILPGTKTPDELISDIKEGIYIKGFSGGTVDVNNGTHSRQAYGSLIRDGKITDIAVDGFIVSGNLKDMFMNIVLANDTPALPGTKHSLAAPTTRINGLTIAGE